MRTALTLLALCLPLAANWANFGGNPERNCLAAVNGPSVPNVLWQGTLFGSYGQQVYIEGERLVTYRYRHTPWFGRVVCHDLATGDTLWSREFPGASGRPMPVGFRDGRVYVVDLKTANSDSLYALDAATGDILWLCPFPVHTYLSESVTHADNGDLIFTLTDFRTARINAATGDTVWTMHRVWPVSGAADVTVHGSTGYCWSGALIGGSMKMYAIDIESGTKRDSALVPDTHPGGPAPQAGFWVGPDNILYGHRVGDNVTAIRDHGDSLEVLWTHEISGEYPYYSPWSQFGCGPDSSVYVPSYGRVFRLDNETGAALDSSEVLQDLSTVFEAHMSVGADGTVYLANGGFSGGMLYALSPDLITLWSVPVPGVNISCPALGPNGELAIAGSDSLLMVFKDPVAVAESGKPRSGGLRCTPSPFAGQARVSSGGRPVRVYDASGRMRHVSSSGFVGDGLEPGVYYLASGTSRVRVVKLAGR